MGPQLLVSIVFNVIAAFCLIYWIVKARRLRKFAVLVLAVLVVFSAVRGARYLIMTRKHPRRQVVNPKPLLVETTPAKISSERVTITVMGQVVPARTVVLQPEVSGLVVQQSPSLVTGGVFKKGEEVLKIDPRDYEYAVEQRKADVERARFDLQVEEGRQAVAEREWTLLRSGQKTDPAGRDLALRKPHIKNAKAALNGAENSLKLAELKVERATIKAPFNALVTQEEVEVGQLVSAQSRLATLVGTDEFWVQVSVPIERLAWITIPGVNAPPGKGAAATVIHAPGNGFRIERKAHVARLLGDLDTAGRMARVLVMVEDPLELMKEKGAHGLPLLIGAYVRVQIQGTELGNVCAVPRQALHEGDIVYIMGKDDRLDMREIKVVWRREQDVLVKSGIGAGERIVTSRIVTPIPGMTLRLKKADAAGKPRGDLLAREEPEQTRQASPPLVQEKQQ